MRGCPLVSWLTFNKLGKRRVNPNLWPRSPYTTAYRFCIQLLSESSPYRMGRTSQTTHLVLETPRICTCNLSNQEPRNGPLFAVPRLQAHIAHC